MDYSAQTCRNDAMAGLALIGSEQNERQETSKPLQNFGILGSEIDRAKIQSFLVWRSNGRIWLQN